MLFILKNYFLFCIHFGKGNIKEKDKKCISCLVGVEILKENCYQTPPHPQEVNLHSYSVIAVFPNYKGFRTPSR